MGKSLWYETTVRPVNTTTDSSTQVDFPTKVPVKVLVQWNCYFLINLAHKLLQNEHIYIYLTRREITEK